MSTQRYSSRAMPAYKLMAAKNEYHQKNEALTREIKKLRGEVGVMVKRYTQAKREIIKLIAKVKSQPPPAIPKRPETEEEKEMREQNGPAWDIYVEECFHIEEMKEFEEWVRKERTKGVKGRLDMKKMYEEKNRKKEEDRMEVDMEEERIRQLRIPSPTPSPMSPKPIVKKHPKNPAKIKIPAVQINTTVAVQSQKIATEIATCFRVSNDTELWEVWRELGPKSKEKSRFSRRGKCIKMNRMDVSWIEMDYTGDGSVVDKVERIWQIGPEKEKGEQGFTFKDGTG